MKHIAAVIIALVSFIASVAAESFIVGIAGGTGSGKTTLARKIQEAFPGQSVLVSQDSYYKDLSSLPPEKRDKVNFDHPDSLDFDLLVSHLQALREGESIQKPVYNFCSHTREDHYETVLPNQLIIVEGILLFSVPEICDYCDLKVFIDADDDVRLLRRITRDIHERSRTFESVCSQYLDTVKPMHEAFVQPSKKRADLIVPRGGENHRAIDLIISNLKNIIHKTKD